MNFVSKYKYFIAGIALLCFFSCSRSKYAAMNTDPDAVLTIDPKTELTPGEISIHSNDFEVFYDYVRYIKPWTQVYVPMTGNTATFMQANGNAGNRWGSFYGGVGDNLEDVIQTIDKMSADKSAQYQYLRAITLIPLAYYAFYVTDAYDRIPYKEAFKARYTIPALLTPTYDAQSYLFDTLDTQLKTAIAVLKSNPSVTQESLGANEVYYQGDPTKWIKAANSLRIKMAMRLMKVNPAKTTAIVNEVLSDDVGPISSVAEDWIFYSTTVGNGGNSNPVNQTIYAGSRNTVGFMVQTADPRLRVFYQKSGISTQDLFDSAKAQGAIPSSATWDGQAYRGQYVTPSASSDASKSHYFQKINFSYKGAALSVYYPSMIQPGLTYATYNNTTGGTNMFPVITYADVCFMRAELAARGLSNDPVAPDSLYRAGIRASCTNYDYWAKITQAPDYKALTADEVENYLVQPGVVYDPTNGIEQICDQEYLNYYVHANELWALVKRTGYPSATGNILQFEDVSSYGTMPRRYAITAPQLSDLNFANINLAIDSMKAEPYFGDPTDMTGRVWWDKP